MHSDSSSATGAIRLLSLSDDALVEGEAPDGSLTIVTRWGEYSLPDPGTLVRESLRRMSMGPISLENVLASGPEPAGGRGHPEWDRLERALQRLSGSLVRSLALDDRLGPLMSVLPAAPAPAFRPPSIAAGQRVRLSRFATIRPCDCELVLESPRARFRVALHLPLAAHVVAALALPATVAEVVESTGAAEGVISDVLAYLVASGTVLLDNGSGAFAEDVDPAVRYWTHHELTFHARSRSRQSDAPCDIVEPDAAALASPVAKPLPDGRRFPLPRPDLSAPAASITELLEDDHTCPEPSVQPLTAAELGELLYRGARIRGPGPEHLPHGMTHEATQRPYASVACLYELELFVSIDRCPDLPRGVYHYDAAGHGLTLVNADGADLAEVLDVVTVAAGCVRRPPAVLTLTARMERMAPLGGAAYSATLQHAGALQQTLHLVAKAMGISAHGVPVDANDTVERVLGLRWPGEVGVGECVLGHPE